MPTGTPKAGFRRSKSYWSKVVDTQSAQDIELNLQKDAPRYISSSDTERIDELMPIAMAASIIGFSTSPSAPSIIIGTAPPLISPVGSYNLEPSSAGWKTRSTFL